MARTKKEILTTEQQIFQVINEINLEKEKMEECKYNIKNLQLKQKELEQIKRVEDGEKLLKAIELKGLEVDKAIELLNEKKAV